MYVSNSLSSTVSGDRPRSRYDAAKPVPPDSAGFCQAKSEKTIIWQLCCTHPQRRRGLSSGEARMNHFRPFCEAPAHDFPVIPSCEQMATWTKERRDNAERCEKPLRVRGRLEAPHSPFAFPRRLVRTLRSIVRPFVL